MPNGFKKRIGINPQLKGRLTQPSPTWTRLALLLRRGALGGTGGEPGRPDHAPDCGGERVDDGKSSERKALVAQDFHFEALVGDGAKARGLTMKS
ncbi:MULTISPECIES: hypothetical protein [unclassified Bradyrhizobium]|uniref:hypothetical protein n=1 Tax=unclassified Bradyrhizobium TaxID=2631580 RepID=UPI0012FC44AB|nr:MULTISPECIES: hypothetical protein [unclassified Bradyrhizobium]MCK1357199.1 hypothetical protein [Bradyrhizobium sp. CW7]MCK1413235.1 hypothetical protein [Bradyrhizobium sp. CW4]MCK1425750.1 hypothetical protein [Bradyrhizobium sp. 87]MCK1577061.1 hypothetical protein [Bradyrhizobium sp. 174]UPJ26866.1 hypothetical protein IVB54_35465 [Bradyrhizobium sp. CW1]